MTDPKERGVYLVETTNLHRQTAGLAARAMTVLRVKLIGGLQTPRVQWKLFRKGGDFFAHALLDGGVAQMREHFGDPSGNFLHFRLAHPSRGHRRTSHANSASLHGGQGIKRNSILVDGHA